VPIEKEPLIPGVGAAICTGAVCLLCSQVSIVYWLLYIAYCLLDIGYCLLYIVYWLFVRAAGPPCTASSGARVCTVPCRSPCTAPSGARGRTAPCRSAVLALLLPAPVVARRPFSSSRLLRLPRDWLLKTPSTKPGGPCGLGPGEWRGENMVLSPHFIRLLRAYHARPLQSPVASSIVDQLVATPALVDAEVPRRQALQDNSFAELRGTQSQGRAGPGRRDELAIVYWILDIGYCMLSIGYLFVPQSLHCPF
jgi:hypothetical protein